MADAGAGVVSESFSVGEIAIYCNGTFETGYDGQECEVVGQLMWRWATHPDGTRHAYHAYRTHAQDGQVIISEPHQLRKRRPPQDWVKLCRLTDLPREVTHV